MLETKIELLTAAINKLTAAMTDCNNEIAQETKAIVEEVATIEPTVKTFTHDDLRDLILKCNRANPDNKVKMKAILEEFGAKKVTDVKESDIEAACEAIKKAVA